MRTGNDQFNSPFYARAVGGIGRCTWLWDDMTASLSVYVNLVIDFFIPQFQLQLSFNPLRHPTILPV